MGFTINNNNMDCSKVARANKMALVLSIDRIAATTDLNPKIRPSFHKALLKQASHDMLPLARVRTVGILHQTLPLNSQVLIKERNRSQAILNNPKLAITHMVTLISLVHIMLRIWINNTRTMVVETTLEHHTEAREDCINNHTKVMVWAQVRHTSSTHLLQRQEASEARLFTGGTVQSVVDLVSMVAGLLSLPRLPKDLELAVHLEVQRMTLSLEVLHIRARANSTTARTKVANQVRGMTWSLSVIRNQPMAQAHHSLRLDVQVLPPMQLQGLHFPHHNLKGDMEVTQVITNRGCMVARPAVSILVLQEQEVTKLEARATKTANTVAIKLSVATTMAITSNVVGGEAITDINRPL
jgi:hypothetical protein